MKQISYFGIFVVLIVLIIGWAEKQLEKPNIEQPEADAQKEQPIAQPEKEVGIEEINETAETQKQETKKTQKIKKT